MLRTIKEAEEVKESFDLYSEKTVVKEFHSLKKVIAASRWVFALFSIVTGAVFLSSQISLFLPFYASISFGVVIVIGLEVLKHNLGKSALARILPKKMDFVGFFLLVFLLFCVSISVFLSVNGAKEAYLQLDNRNEILESQFKAKKDSLNQKHQSERKRLEAAQERFFDANQVYVNKQTGNVLRYNATTEYNRFSDLIYNAEETKRKELEKMSTQFEENKNKLLSKANFNLNFWIVSSIAVELLILLCMYFVIWYYFQIYIEGQYLVPDENKYSTLARSLVSYNVAPAATVQEIGFKPKTTGKNQAKEWALQKDIRNGETDIKKLMIRHKVNVNTVTKILNESKKEKTN